MAAGSSLAVLTESTPLKGGTSASATASTGGPSTSTTPTGGNASIVTSFFNVANSMIGSGLVVLPHAFSQAGWAFGLVIVSFTAIISITTSFFITESISTVNAGSSFRTISNAAFPHLSLFTDLAVAVSMIGAGCIYVIVAADMLDDALEGPRELWISLIGLIVVPLCFLRTMDSLSVTSCLSVLMFTYIMVLVVLFAIGGWISPVGEFFNGTHTYNGTHFRRVHSRSGGGGDGRPGETGFLYLSPENEILIVPNDPLWQTPEEEPFDLEAWRNSMGGAGLIDPCPADHPNSLPGAETSCHRSNFNSIGRHPIHAFGAVALQFACQPTVPLIQAELHNPTRARVLIVYTCAVGFVWIFYAIVALCGYHTFGNNVHENLLLMYPKNWLTFGGTLCLGFIVVFTFPLSCQPFRVSATNLVRELGSLCGLEEPSEEAASDSKAEALVMDKEGGMLHAEPPATKPVAPVFLDNGAQIAATTIFLVTTLTIAFTTRELGPLVDYFGSFGNDSVCITAPALIYAGVHRRSKDVFLLLAVVLVIYGVALTATGTLVPLISPDDLVKMGKADDPLRGAPDYS